MQTRAQHSIACWLFVKNSYKMFVCDNRLKIY